MTYERGMKKPIMTCSPWALVFCCFFDVFLVIGSGVVVFLYKLNFKGIFLCICVRVCVWGIPVLPRYLRKNKHFLSQNSTQINNHISRTQQ